MSRLPPITEAQFQAALQWLSRINEQPGQAEGAAFKRWLLADPAHRAAYEQAQVLWQKSAAPAARLADEEQDALQRYLDAMARPPARGGWRRVARLALAACLVLAVGVAGGWHPGYWLQDLQADYSSAGQIRQVTLADQSQVTLDAGSAIAVDFAQGERRVRLLHGAAFFEVTHTGEPFLVEAAGGEVRVLGTQFEVRAQGEGAQVTVRSGRVGVSPAQGTLVRELTANQQVTYRAGRVGDTLAVDSDNRLAWRQGWLNYYQVPLAQVIEDLGRYYPGRILLLDGDLGQRKVSGSFPVAEPLLALDSLGKVMGFSRQTVLGRLTLVR
ncbi:FecR domain-containing protein [Pseudomonas putida]|uniref:Sugar ABC transporter substrate-binding protein n=2 Tax=Pseudomonas putida group TaxID=136845 RepID=A0A2N1IUX1_9PSED|nr:MULTISPECIES: FecR domain-containing protein [Pseudomonas putida group]MCG3642136.1 FecR domain-containing protein [Pseudomonas putida]PKI24521.1 sugar ABC transporter substrate-binding protein [Pseudomonas monteilii]POF92079.1 sugar ABC transporter substrate-binding protein [Pseudomonas putida]POG14450.1 sugar ABC transporter substrate-binding protein [Pseudomonas putida]QRI85028.1 FecR domain-containing protein [Pseudomonas putida]